MVLLMGASYNLMAMQGRHDHDPLANIKYRTAFDQSKIHQDFADCMEQWGCARNVFGGMAMQAPRPVVVDLSSQITASGCREVVLFPVEYELVVVSEDPVKTTKPHMSREQAYQEACMSKLRSARRWAIGAPLQDFGVLGGTLCCCAIALQKGLERFKDPSVQQAVGFGWMNLLYNLGFRFEGAIRSGIHLYWPPEQRLEKLEEQFAKNMCFIPRQLWGKIIEEFMAARTNQMTQDEHIANTEFAVNLTTHKPLKSLIIADGKNLEEAVQEICARIENFFKANYQVPQDYLTEDVVNIQNAVRDFLRALAYNPQGNNPVKPLFLKGSYGIGKSFFVVDNLYKWIEELFPGSIKLEQLQHLTSANELQGSAGREHGIMLDIVCNKCKADARGSLVFVDEGTWLNNPSMIDIAKVVFNGYQSRVSTKYFDRDVDIPVPPMLIIVASNGPIKEEPLASRFKQIEFPKPSVKALVDYAIHKAEQDESLRLQGVSVTRPDAQDFIDPSPLQCLLKGRKAVDNFRDADKIVTHLLAKKSHKPLLQEVP
jgi:hypothetical protein